MNKFHRFTNRLLFASVLATTLTACDTAAATQTTTLAPLPAVVEEYFAGWNAFDGQRVLATFTPDGIYADPSVPDGVSGPALAANVEKFKGYSFKLLSYGYLADGSPEILWEMFDPSGKFLVKGKDIITIVNGKLARVQGSW
ncbi:MAG: hypothetical protein V4805_04810 [Pseudomonadota bacterium]